MTVSVRQRILTIRLMEKVNAHPAYAEALGLVVQNPRPEHPRQTPSDSAGSKS